MREQKPLRMHTVRFQTSELHNPASDNAPACTSDDIQTVSAKFVEMHSDPLCVKDCAATTILTIQYNLAIGTILQYSSGRSDLGNTIAELLKFEKMYVFKVGIDEKLGYD